MPVRQAGAIYLKNTIVSNWADKDPSQPTQPLADFSIHEQDRALIRDKIIDAIVVAPDLIRVHLGVCINHIIKNDFASGRCNVIVEKTSLYLESDASNWLGALTALYQLVKNFEYKNNEDRAPLMDSLRHLLPQIYQCCVNLLPDQSDHSVLLQKQILKIFHALVQYSMPMTLLTRDLFTQWMEILRQVVERPVPPETNQIDIEERPELSWWKAKKWALHILARVFERYGSPGNVNKEYREFADWYIKTFSHGIIQVMLRVLEEYGKKNYVSQRVLQQALNYLNIAYVSANNFF